MKLDITFSLLPFCSTRTLPAHVSSKFFSGVRFRNIGAILQCRKDKLNWIKFLCIFILPISYLAHSLPPRLSWSSKQKRVILIDLNKNKQFTPWGVPVKKSWAWSYSKLLICVTSIQLFSVTMHLPTFVNGLCGDTWVTCTNWKKSSLEFSTYKIVYFSVGHYMYKDVYPTHRFKPSASSTNPDW